MIWGDIAAVLDTSLPAAQGVYYGKHRNPNLMNAMLTALAVTELPEVRSDAVIFGAGIDAIRFVRSRSYYGHDFGYIALIVWGGAPAVVVRSVELTDLENYHFFKTDVMAFEFVDVLKRRGKLVLGARVQLEALSHETGYSVFVNSKAHAYRALRVATADKAKAMKTVNDLTLSMASMPSYAKLAAALVHANAWLVAATARHGAALSAYQAHGGLVV
jgi:hypothetical protein